MGLQLVPLIIVGAYLLGMLLVGFLSNKLFIKNSADYMLAGRRLGLMMVACSLAANNIGGGSTMGVSARAFNGWGLSAAWYVLAACVAMIPLIYFAPKIRKVMAYTIPEVITRRFGAFAGGFSAVLNIVSLFCLTASQILASGTVVATLTGMPLNVAVFLSGTITLVYTVMGGMMADAISDLVQWVIIFLGLLVAVPFVVSGVGGWEVLASKLPPLTLSMDKVGWFMIISLILNYFCTFMSGPEMVSRFSAAENEKTAKRASLLSAVLMASMAFLPTLIGLAALSVNPGLDGGKGTSALMWATSTYAPPVVTGLLAAAIIAATMSSADSNLLCGSTIFMKDIYLKYINPKLSDEKRIILLTRLSNVVIGVLAMAFALLKVDIVTLNLFAFALRSAGPFAAYTLGIAWKKATPHAGVAAIVVGSVAAVVWELLGQPLGIMSVVFGCACSALAFVVVTLVESNAGVAPAPSAEAGE